jgi:ElaB/YqjD/DUF883 family membrane-anchored ribosome-binding protein
MIPKICSGLMRRLRCEVRALLASMVMLIVGALFFAAAVGFAVASAYLWLSMRMSDPAALLAVAGGLLVVGAALSTAALRKSRSAAAPAHSGRTAEDEMPEDGRAELERLSHQLVKAAHAEVAKAPLKAVLTAVALGLVVGVLRGKKSS